MVMQPPLNNDDDPGRFQESTAPDHALQIRLAEGIVPLELWQRGRIDLVGDRSDSGPDDSAAPFTVFLFRLKALDAVSITWPLGVTPQLQDILTDEEKRRRAAIIEVTFPSNVDLVRAARLIGELDVVRQAVPVPEDSPPSTNDPLMGVDDQNLATQWYLFRIRAHRAWAVATGQSVVIGDVDFGYRVSHQDLSNIEPGKAYNSHDGTGDVGQGGHISHGTAVLGLAGAARDGTGMVGIAFDASLWPIQANTGTGPKKYPDKWARGIDYILETDSGGRRKVAILEVETTKGSCYEMRPSTNEAIQQAIAHDIVVVVAAGNGGKDVSLDDDGLEYPETGSILVGATGFHRKVNPRSCSSNYGPRLAISAPGYGPADITCGADADDSYRPTFGGTSGAAPKVAAACALMLEVDPSLTHGDVKQILMATGSEVLTTPNRPAGMFLNVNAAVRQVRRNLHAGQGSSARRVHAPAFHETGAGAPATSAASRR